MQHIYNSYGRPRSGRPGAKKPRFVRPGTLDFRRQPPRMAGIMPDGPRYTKSKRNRHKSVRVWVATLALMLAGLLTVGGVYAWFTAEDSVLNSLKTPQQDFSAVIEEVFDPPGVVTPGTPVPKEVRVANTAQRPGFVRVLVLPVITAADGTLLQAQMGHQVLADLNTDHWMEGGDGYYYYLGRLEPGERTPPLFTEITLELAAEDEAYTGAHFTIEVKCEAVEGTPQAYRDGWWQGKPPRRRAAGRNRRCA